MGLNQIILDKEKKIIFNTRWWYDQKDIVTFITHIRHFFNTIYEKINLDNSVDIGENIIAIQSWFTTYGHFLDEVYNLKYFLNKIENKFNDNNYKILYSILPGNQYQNYLIISDKLFKDKYINPLLCDALLLKCTNLLLIKHSIKMDTFHSFPKTVTDFIIKNSEKSNNLFNYKKIFITRSIDKSVNNRSLTNQLEIEDYFSKFNDFTIINPENTFFDGFINYINYADIIVITWGSALTNLVFLKPNTKVFILKSKSYEHESIELFRKIINQLNLDVNVILHKDNLITLHMLNLNIFNTVNI